MKTVGIIGGLGPETTAKFYLEVVFACQEREKAHRPPVLISSVPISYQAEEDAIAGGRGEERLLPLLTDAAKQLEGAGADFLVMPCNSLHIFIGDIRRAVRIPVVSIVEETVTFLQRERIPTVGMLATPLTVKRKLYDKALQAAGITLVLPDDAQQARIGNLIHRLVSNRTSDGDRAALIAMLERFERHGVAQVLLACTDLQLLIPQHPRVKVVDTMKLLADATVSDILHHG